MTIHLLDYTFPSESFLKTVVFHFSPVRVYLPWYMDPPDFIMNNPGIICSYPSGDLKPEKSFKNILLECLAWLRQHHDKSLIEILKSGYRDNSGDDTIWEIRRLLGNNIRSGSTSPENRAVQWHLILHLAKEMEAQMSEANRILFNLRHRPPLLDKSVEKAIAAENLLEDLSGFNHESTLNDTRLTRIIEAWFGLFGSLIPENEIIFTGSTALYNHIVEQWNVISGETNIFSLKGVSFRFPNLIDSDLEGRIKNVEEKLENIKSLIYSVGTAPKNNLAGLERLCSEYDALVEEMGLPVFSRCTVNHLYSLPDEAAPGIKPFFTYLSGRTIMLIEEN